jgi:transposase
MLVMHRIMHCNFNVSFKEESVRLSRDSGLGLGQVAKDLGIGKLTLNSWRKEYSDRELLCGSHDDKDKELARLRKENEILRAERDLLKKAAAKHCYEQCLQMIKRTMQALLHEGWLYLAVVIDPYARRVILSINGITCFYITSPRHAGDVWLGYQ